MATKPEEQETQEEPTKAADKPLVPKDAKPEIDMLAKSQKGSADVDKSLTDDLLRLQKQKATDPGIENMFGELKQLLSFGGAHAADGQKGKPQKSGALFEAAEPKKVDSSVTPEGFPKENYSDGSSLVTKTDRSIRTFQAEGEPRTSETKLSDGSKTIEFKNGSSLEFDQLGNIQTARNSEGMVQRYEYTDGKLSAVKDEDGKYLAKADENGQLRQVRPDGKPGDPVRYDTNSGAVSTFDASGTPLYTTNLDGSKVIMSPPRSITVSGSSGEVEYGKFDMQTKQPTSIKEADGSVWQIAGKNELGFGIWKNGESGEQREFNLKLDLKSGIERRDEHDGYTITRPDGSSQNFDLHNNLVGGRDAEPRSADPTFQVSFTLEEGEGGDGGARAVTGDQPTPGDIQPRVLTGDPPVQGDVQPRGLTGEPPAQGDVQPRVLAENPVVQGDAQLLGIAGVPPVQGDSQPVGKAGTDLQPQAGQPLPAADGQPLPGQPAFPGQPGHTGQPAIPGQVGQLRLGPDGLPIPGQPGFPQPGFPPAGSDGGQFDAGGIGGGGGIDAPGFSDLAKLANIPYDLQAPHVDCLQVAPALRNEVSWADAATNQFLREGNPELRNRILENIMKQVQDPANKNPEHFLKVFLELSKVQAAHKIINATTDQERLEATRDFMLFKELTRGESPLGGANLLKAIKEQSLNPGDGDTKTIKVNMGGGGTEFVRAAVEAQQKGNVSGGPIPKDLPPSLQKVFEKHPGTWEDAARDFAGKMKGREEHAQAAMDTIMQPNSKLTPAEMKAQLDALKKLDAELPTKPFGGAIVSLEAYTSVQTLLKTTDLKEAQEALKILQSNGSFFGTSYASILGASAFKPLNSEADLQARRKQHSGELSKQAETDRGQFRLALMLKNMEDYVRTQPIDPPSSDALNALQKQLQTEIAAGNEAAKKPMEWVQTQLLLNKISEAGGINQAKPFAQQLMGMVKRPDGSINQYALSAVTSLIGGSASESLQLSRASKGHDSENGDNLRTYPGRLKAGFDDPVAFRNEIAKSLQHLVNDNNIHLTAGQVHTLALGLSRPEPGKEGTPHQQNQDKEFRTTVESMLRRELRVGENYSPEREARAKAVCEACISGATGLGSVMLELTDTTSFAGAAGEINKQAKKGDRDAIAILSALASNTVGGADQSREAAKTLAEIASANGGQYLNRVTDIVMATLKQRGDHGQLLEVLGNLSYLSAKPNSDVGMALWQGYIKSYNPGSSSFDQQGPLAPVAANDFSATPLAHADAQTQAEHRKSAALALLSDPRHLDDAVIGSIASHPTNEMALAIHELVPNLSQYQRDVFLKEFERNLRAPSADSLRADDLANLQNQLLAFQAFGAFADQSVIKFHLAPLLELKVKDDHPLKKQLESLQETAIESVLSMLNSPNKNTRDAVFNYLESRQWPPAMMKHLRDGISDFVHNAQHCSVQELQRALTLVPGSDICPPLSVVLLQAGVKSGDLQELASEIQARAAKNPEEFGKTILPMLMAAAAWEKMPPEQRRELAERGKPTPDFNVTEIAKALARGECPLAADFLLGLNERLQKQLNEIDVDNNEALRQLKFEHGLYSKPADAHVKLIQELHQLKEQEEKWKAEQLKGWSLSVVASMVGSLTLPDSPQAARIKAVEKELEHLQKNGGAYIYDTERYLQRMEKIGERLVDNAGRMAELRAAEALLLYPQMRALGRNEDADKLLLNMWSHNQLPESLKGDFNRLWERMHALGATPTEKPPVFSGKPEEQYKQALDILSSLKVREQGDSALSSLRDALLRSVEARCQKIILGQPAVGEAAKLEGQVARQTMNLRNYFQIVAATEDGQRNEDLIKHVTNISANLDTLLNKASVPVRNDLGTMITDLQKRLDAMPKDAAGRGTIETMIKQLTQQQNFLDPNSKENKDFLKPIIDDCKDGRPLKNHDWFTRSSAALLRFVVVTAACAAAQTGCELLNEVPGLGHAFSMVVVPAVATAGNHLVDEGLFSLGMSNRGSYLLDGALGRHQYDPQNGVHYQLTGQQVAKQLAKQYQAEFEMNAAAGGFGWLGGRVGQLAGRGMGLTERVAGQGAQASIASRFARNFVGMAGPGLLLTSVDIANGELKLNAPTALLGLGVAFMHGGRSHFKAMERPQPGLQRLLPENAIRQKSSTEAELNKVQATEANRLVIEQLKAGKMPATVAERALGMMHEGQLSPAAVKAIADLPAHLRAAHIDKLMSDSSSKPAAIETALKAALQSHLETQHPSAKTFFEQLSKNNQLSVEMAQSLNSLTPAQMSRLATMPVEARNTVLEAARGLPTSERASLLQKLGSLSETQALHTAELLKNIPEQQRGAVAANLGKISPELLPKLIDSIQTLPAAERAQTLLEASRLPATVMNALGNMSDAAARGRMMQTLGAASAGEFGAARVEQLNNLLSQIPQAHQNSLLEAVGGVKNAADRSNALNSILNQLGTTSAVGTNAVRNFAEDLAAIPNAAKRIEVLQAIAEMPPSAASDLLRAFGHFKDSPARGEFLRQLSEMAPEARAGLLKQLATMESSVARNELIGKYMSGEPLQAPKPQTSQPTTPAGSVSKPPSDGPSVPSDLPGGTKKPAPETQPTRAEVQAAAKRAQLEKDFGQDAKDLLAAMDRSGLNLPLEKLGQMNRDQLKGLKALCESYERLGEAARSGKLPEGLTAEQLKNVQEAIKTHSQAISKESNPQFVERLKDLDKIANALLGPRTGEFTAQKASAVADIMAASRDVPRGLNVPFNRLLAPETTSAGLESYKQILQQLKGLEVPVGGGSDAVAWKATEKIAATLKGSAVGADWAFLPAAKGAQVDQMGIDGTFINLKTGELRPVDFKQTNSKRPWVMDVRQSGSSLFHPKDPLAPIEFIKAHLQRTEGTGLLPELLKKVGMPDFGRPVQGPEAFQQQLSSLRDYITRLHQEMAKIEKTGGTVPEGLKQLADGAVRSLPTLHGQATLSQHLSEYLTNALAKSAGDLTIKPQGEKSVAIEIDLPAKAHFDVDVPQPDGSVKRVEQYVDKIRIHPDGRVEAVADGHKWELGKVKPIFESAIKSLEARVKANPGDTAAADTLRSYRELLSKIEVRLKEASEQTPSGKSRPANSADKNVEGKASADPVAAKPEEKPVSAVDRLDRITKQMRDQAPKPRDPETLLEERTQVNKELNEAQARKVEMDKIKDPTAKDLDEYLALDMRLKTLNAKFEGLRLEMQRSLDTRLDPSRAALKEQLPALELEIKSRETAFFKASGENIREKTELSEVLRLPFEPAERAKIEARIKELDQQRIQLDREYRLSSKELTDLKEAAQRILSNGGPSSTSSQLPGAAAGKPFNKEAFAKIINEARPLDIALQAEKMLMPKTRDGSSNFFMKTARDIPVEVTGNVSDKQALEVLDRIGNSIVKPCKIEIINDKSQAFQGLAQTARRYSTVKLNFTDRTSLTMVYDHELGHVLDYSQIKSNPALAAKVAAAYGADMKASGLDPKITDLLSKHDYVSPAAKDAAQYGLEGVSDLQRHKAYVNSRDEIVAEAFKIFMQEKSVKPGEKPLSYKELVEARITDPYRKEAMLKFESTYNALKNDVFEFAYSKEMQRRSPKVDGASKASTERPANGDGLASALPPTKNAEQQKFDSLAASRELTIKKSLVGEQQAIAIQSMDKLKQMVAANKIDPILAGDIVDMMSLVARRGKVLSPEAIESLAHAQKDQLMNLNGERQAMLADALNAKAISAEELSRGLDNPARFAGTLDLLANAKASRTYAQAEQITGLPAAQQNAMKALFNEARVLAEGFDAVMKSLQGYPPSGSEKFLKPDVVARLACGGASEHLQLREAAVLASRDYEGTLNRSPDCVQKMLELQPGAAPEFAALAKNDKVTDAQLNIVHKDLIAITDPTAQADRSSMHLRLAFQDSVMHQNLLAIENPQLRSELMKAAVLKQLDSAQLSKIVEAHKTSPEMAAIIDKLLPLQSGANNQSARIESIINHNLNPVELALTRKALESGSISQDHLLGLLRAGTGRQSALELAMSGKIKDIDVLVKIAQDPDLASLAKAARAGTLDANSAKTLMELGGDQAQHVRAILREQAAYGKHNQAELIDALSNPQKAFRQALNVDLNFHANPELIKVQRAAIARIDKIAANVSADARTALEEMARTELAKLSTTEPREVALRMKQLEWLEKKVEGMPKDKASVLAEQFAGSRLKASAYVAGADAKIAGDLELFLHGTDQVGAKALVEKQGATLSSENGRHSGKFFTTTEAPTAWHFADRMVADPSRAAKGEQPTLVGIALPKPLADSLRQRGLIYSEPIADRSGMTQTIFKPEAIQILKDHGYFFKAD